MKKLFCLAAVLILAFALTACGSSASDHDPYLVGSWRWTVDGAYVYTFNADGTGERGFAESIQAFTWANDGNRLEISRDQAPRRETQNEVWTFEIYDFTLNLVNNDQEDLNFSYERMAEEYYAELLGSWAWDADEHFILTLNPNGTGTRGRIFEAESFTWEASGEDERLNIIRNTAPFGVIRGEMWEFVIIGDTLILTSRQDDYAPQLIYTRAS